jgi:hypothetical protein
LQGERGAAGERGEHGEKGEKGEAGPQGEKGLAGESGARGDQGVPGEKGAQGERGQDGKDGRDGTLPVVKLWRPNLVHYAREVVAFDGATFQALKDTGQAPNTEDWICLATAGRDGRDGVDGRPLRVRGTHREGEHYEALDVVAHNGGSYIARRDDPGDCPGDGWQSLTLPGKRGASGLKGDAGPQGERGPKGEPGRAAPEIIGWEIDAENYVVVAVLSDQTRSAPLDLRGVFEQYLQERINAQRG